MLNIHIGCSCSLLAAPGERTSTSYSNHITFRRAARLTGSDSLRISHLKRRPTIRHITRVVSMESPEVETSGTSEGSQAQQDSMAQYQNLKSELQGRTLRFGGFFALYLYLVANAEAAVCTLIGTAAGYGYLLLLMRDVDNLKPGDRVPFLEAGKIEFSPLRAVAKGAATYQQALQPRLLVLVALAGGLGAYNSINVEHPISLFGEAAMLGGFLSYKIALFLQVYDDLKYKFDPTARGKPEKPVIVREEDPEDLDAILKRIIERKR